MGKNQGGVEKKFILARYMQDIFHRYYEFKQDEIPLEEYNAKFEQFMMKCDLLELEEQTIAW